MLPSRLPGLRPAWQRLAALCLAVWFAVAMADLPALHTCVMHGGAPPAAAATAGHVMGHAETHADMHAAAHAHAAAAGHARHGREGAPAHAGHVCSCLGACCGAAPPLGPPAPAALALASGVVDAPAAPGRPAHEYVAAWVDFVLPFSTAPPARAAV